MARLMNLSVSKSKSLSPSAKYKTGTVQEIYVHEFLCSVVFVVSFLCTSSFRAHPMALPPLGVEMVGGGGGQWYVK
jgi:hypothetical protein